VLNVIQKFDIETHNLLLEIEPLR